MDVVTNRANRMIDLLLTDSFSDYKYSLQKLSDDYNQFDLPFDRIKYINMILKAANNLIEKHRPKCQQTSPEQCVEEINYQNIQFFLVQELNRMGVSTSDGAMPGNSTIGKNRMAITPELKDQVLNWLCIHLQPEEYCSLNLNKIQTLDPIVEINSSNLTAILTYFRRKGFVRDLNTRHTDIQLVLCVDAIDFNIRGGFVGQEEYLEKNIDKLLVEIEYLKKELSPDYLETFNKLSSISSAIMSALGLLNK